MQTKCLIFGFCCGLPLAQVKIITATANGHTATNDNNHLRRPAAVTAVPPCFASASFLCTPPSPFRLIVVDGTGRCMETFGRTRIKLVHLSWWIIIHTTAAPVDGNAPFSCWCICVLFRESVISRMSLFPPPHTRLKKKQFSVQSRKGSAIWGRGSVVQERRGGTASEGREGRRGGKAAARGPGQGGAGESRGGDGERARTQGHVPAAGVRRRGGCDRLGTGHILRTSERGKKTRDSHVTRTPCGETGPARSTRVDARGVCF